jgi:hypothetical protein
MLSCGFTCKLSGWTHTRDFAKGFLRNTAGTGLAVVEGLTAGAFYYYKIYQFASAHAATNSYSVNGVPQGTTTSKASDDATATGTVLADSAGKITFEFSKDGLLVYLSGIALAESGAQTQTHPHW